MTDLSKAEAEITRLCEIAEAKGWRFSSLSRGNNCGCALQAAGHIVGKDWRSFGFSVPGIFPSSFGAGFDDVARGVYPTEYPYSDNSSANYELGAKLARRFVHKEGVSDA